jgi:hypothetical protein
MGTGVKEKTWRLISITDHSANRKIDCRPAESYLYFGTQHLQWQMCNIKYGKYSFDRPGRLEIQWSEPVKDSCDLLHQQMAWYGRYRMNELLYQVEGDTLELSHATGVRFKLVVQSLPLLPKK